MTIPLKDLKFIGNNLHRPECVLATLAGNLYVSDFRGGVTQITSDGTTKFFGGGAIDTQKNILQPNGICMLEDRSFLAAHLGDVTGGIYRVERNGNISAYLTHIDNHVLPPCNFIFLDHQGRLWLTVSTRKIPRASAYRADIADGFIAVIDDKGARIVADNIGYTNEVYVTPDGKQLYVNATFARQTLRYDIVKNNSLVNRKTVIRYGHGIYPDGLTMDKCGDLWVTSIVSNRVVRVNTVSNTCETVIEDADKGHVQWVEDAYQRHQIGRQHLDSLKSIKLQNISSLAFGGENLQTCYLGCLLGENLAVFKSNIQGLPPAHWKFDSY